MANPKYVTLGEKAQSFSCPTTGLTLSGKKIVELTPKMLASVKIIQALRGGHLVYSQAPGEVEEEEEEDDNGNFTEAALKKFDKAKLKVIALELLEDEDEEDEGDINGYNRADLIDFIMSKQPDPEE